MYKFKAKFSMHVLILCFKNLAESAEGGIRRPDPAATD